MPKKTVNLIALLIIIPCLFLAIGIYQQYRISTLDTKRNTITQQLQALEALPEPTTNHRDYITLNINRGKLLDAQFKLKNELLKIDENNLALKIASLLPPLTLFFSTCALLIALFSLYRISNIGSIAKTSRATLLQVFSIGHRWLPWIMLSVTICITLSGTLATSTIALMNTHKGMMSGNESKAQILFALLALSILWAGIYASYVQYKHRQTIIPNTLPIFGRSISKTEAPNLWQWVENLANKIRTSTPDHVVLGLCDGFFVTSSEVELHPQSITLQGKTLYLPLTYLAFLSQGETEAIIGHELAHFAGDDTEYSIKFLPIYTSIIKNIEHTHNTSEKDTINEIILKPALSLANYFFEQFDNAVKYWSRERELAADTAGAAISSTQSAACALIRTSVLHKPIDEIISQPRLNPNHTNQSQNLIQELFTTLQTKGLEDPNLHLEDKWAHPTDTHPPTRQRIEALGEIISPELLNLATRPIDKSCFAFTDNLIGSTNNWSEKLTKDLYTSEIESINQRTNNLDNSHIVYHPTKMIMWSFIGLAIAQLIGIIFITQIGLTDKDGFDSKNLMLLCILIVGTIAACLTAKVMHRKGLKPFLIANQQQLQIDGINTPLSWLNVEKIEVYTGDTSTVILTFKEKALLPNITHNHKHLRINANSRLLTINIPNLKKAEQEKLAIYIHEYHDLAKYQP